MTHGRAPRLAVDWRLSTPPERELIAWKHAKSGVTRQLGFISLADSVHTRGREDSLDSTASWFFSPLCP